jgi:hypothetical protein
MAINSALRVLNELRTAEIVASYAIGGAVAAFLYIESGTTFDLDVFIAWKPGPTGLLTPPPLFEELGRRGYVHYEKEAIMIEGWAVQFLPAATPLLEEALAQAVPVEIEGVPTFVFSKEHLMAISLQTARPKDFARLVQFIQEGAPDQMQFEKILERNSLSETWIRFKNRYLDDP